MMDIDNDLFGFDDDQLDQALFNNENSAVFSANDFDDIDSDNDSADSDSPFNSEEDIENSLDEIDNHSNSTEIESDLSDEELDAELAELNSQIAEAVGESESTESSTDESSESYSDMMFSIDDDDDFITADGDIVFMNPDDTEDNFKIIYTDPNKLLVSNRIRVSINVDDLVKSIQSTGLLKPIDVALTDAEGYYVILDGYRRVAACIKAGKISIPCVVNRKVRVKDVPVLAALYNHTKKYTMKEIIEYIDYLEKKKGIMSASMIEYLLQLNSGEYTKLKDILNDNDEDIVDKLMNGQYTIETAFKKLEQRRKKETAEEKDLKQAIRVYNEEPDSGAEEIEGSGETGDENIVLTDEEIANLSVNFSNFTEADDEDLDELVNEGNSIEGYKAHKQDPKYRERLDPTLRKSVLARDNNTCQICKQISGMEFTEVLDVHHIQEVYLGGSDDINNLVTACTVCHKLIHQYAHGNLNIRPKEEMNEIEQNRFKRIVKLGNKIRLDLKARGMSVEELKKLDNASTIGRTKPGEGQVAG